MIRRNRLLGVVTILTVVAAGLPADTRQDARALYEEGMASLSVDDPYRAVDSFRSAIRLNPAYADARIGMARALFLLSEYDDAYREIGEARKYAAGQRELLLLEARILTALRQYSRAEVIYFDILRSRPHDGDANRGLAVIYAPQGQRELAEAANCPSDGAIRLTRSAFLSPSGATPVRRFCTSWPWPTGISAMKRLPRTVPAGFSGWTVRMRSPGCSGRRRCS